MSDRGRHPGVLEAGEDSRHEEIAVSRHDVGGDDPELVTAQSCCDVAVANGFVNDACGEPDQLVTGLMSEGVVDLFEPVEVDDQNLRKRASSISM
mgnify:CR=1 FL=1